MAEENKEASKASGGFKAAVKILLGIALIIAGAYLCLIWKGELIALIKGCLGPLIILIGLVFVAIAKE